MRQFRWSANILLISVTLLLPGASAFADEGQPPPSPAEVASAVTANVPMAETTNTSVSGKATSASALTESNASETVTLPATAAGAVSLTPKMDPSEAPSIESTAPGDDSGASSGLDAAARTSPSLGIDQSPLPAKPDSIAIGIPGSAPHETTVDGRLAVYQGTAADASTAVETNSDGLSVITVLGGADAPTDYAYPLSIPDGGAIQSTDAGGYVITDSTGIAVATISAPWATDANGTSLPTSYTLNGKTLVQHVDTTNAVFPVTSDPHVTLSCHFPWTDCHFDISRDLTKSLWAKLGRFDHASSAALAGAFALACTPAAGFGAAVCAVIGGVWGGYAMDQLQYAAAHHECLSPHYISPAGLVIPNGVIKVDNGPGCLDS